MTSRAQNTRSRRQTPLCVRAICAFGWMGSALALLGCACAILIGLEPASAKEIVCPPPLESGGSFYDRATSIAWQTSSWLPIVAAPALLVAIVWLALRTARTERLQRCARRWKSDRRNMEECYTLHLEEHGSRVRAELAALKVGACAIPSIVAAPFHSEEIA